MRNEKEKNNQTKDNTKRNLNTIDDFTIAQDEENNKMCVK